MTTEELYRADIEAHGEEHQLNLLIEEMAELIQAINKYRRYGKKSDLVHIAEETADVKIMLEQLELIFEPYDFCKIEDDWRNSKLKRLEARLKNKGVI